MRILLGVKKNYSIEYGLQPASELTIYPNLNSKCQYQAKILMKMLLLDHLIPYSLKIGTTRLKSLLRKIPRTITRAGGDTFPSGLLYKPLFLVLTCSRRV